MVEALLITGSNMGDRRAYLTQAIASLALEGVETLAMSEVYETEPWGDIPQQNYYNQVLRVQTCCSAEQLLTTMLEVEHKLGRVRGEQQFGPRTIDIDMLLYADAIVDTPTLTLPHPRMHLRRFVLEPACAVAPLWVHPVFKQTLRVLLSQCTDEGLVWLA